MQNFAKIFVTILLIGSPISNINAKIANDLNITEVLLHKKPINNNPRDNNPRIKTKISAKEKAFNKKNLKTITSYDYDLNKTYKLKLSTFISTIISLPKDEKIISYKLGDNNIFNIHHDLSLPNILTINVLENGYYTNLLVISDKSKIYNFYLKSYNDNSKITPDFTVYIKKNAEELKAELLSTLKENNDKISDVKKLDKLNTSYKIKGDKDIAPLYVYDDGKFTYIDFGDKYISGRFPTVYKIVDKQDSVVNNFTKGNLIIIETLSPEGFTLKNGDKHVCIIPKRKLSEVYKNE